MANLTSLTTTAELTQYRVDGTVDPTEQNSNEGTIKSKLDTVISAINDGSVVETATVQTITALKTFSSTSGLKVDRIQSTSANDTVYLGPTGSSTGDRIADRDYVDTAIATAGTLSLNYAYGGIQTGNFNAIRGYAYAINTTSSAFTGTLPASPSNGDLIGFVDIKGQFATNNFTIARNGKTIMDLSEDLVMNTNYGTAYLVYSSAAGGWYFL